MDSFSKNRLGESTSPYLLQHRSNPVHWQPWAPDVLAHARENQKPILLSVGYSACHWCHVMAHESFENDTIAAVMNEHYVCIKIDREERPDLDQLYQSALHLMGEQGGWPLTLFILPTGEPFWGGTYFPPEPRYGRPSFPEVLKGIAAALKAEPDKVNENANAIMTALKSLDRGAGATIEIGALDHAAQGVLNMIDPVTGGTQGAPKFPQVSLLGLLWRGAHRLNSTAMADAVTLSLAQMCNGGIYDHLGGGFSRYSTDEVWLAPHFEKMLYDNAQLLELLAEAWAVTGDALYKVRAEETVTWLMREMAISKDGLTAFASALDADSEGREGKFYIWQEAEIDTLLGDDATAFKKAYDVTPRGNWHEGGAGANILNRTHTPPDFSDVEAEAGLKTSRDILLEARAGRVRPGLDDKVLTDWNAMMVAALASAGIVFGHDDWIEIAKGTFAFMCRELEKDGRLYHCQAGEGFQPGMLDDVAHMARAALALHAATGDVAYLSRATAWTREADTFFRDEAAGGYFTSAHDAADLVVRIKNFSDHAVPSGNAVMAEVLARLFHMTADASYGERTEAVFAALPGGGPEHLINASWSTGAAELLQKGVSIIIVGDGAPADTLARAAAASGHPLRIIQRIADTSTLDPGHPAAGKAMVNGEAAAYVCRSQTCEAPITNAEALKERLRSG